MSPPRRASPMTSDWIVNGLVMSRAASACSTSRLTPSVRKDSWDKLNSLRFCDSRPNDSKPPKEDREAKSPETTLCRLCGQGSSEAAVGLDANGAKQAASITPRKGSRWQDRP